MCRRPCGRSAATLSHLLSHLFSLSLFLILSLSFSCSIGLVYLVYCGLSVCVCVSGMANLESRVPPDRERPRRRQWQWRRSCCCPAEVLQQCPARRPASIGHWQRRPAAVVASVESYRECRQRSPDHCRQSCCCCCRLHR